MYTKLFAQILDSSVWLQPHATRVVWVTFLAAMDEDGFVRLPTVAAVAKRASATLEEAAAAVAYLSSPDEHSSDQSHDGRRIEAVPGGWVVLNAAKFRDISHREDARRLNRERVRRYRERRSGNAVAHPCNAAAPLGNANGDDCNDSVIQSDTDTEADTDTDVPSSVVLEFPTKGTPSVWRCPRALVDDWTRLYPTLDIEQELRRAVGYLKANPGRLSAAADMPARLVNWLNRAIDGRPGRKPAPPSWMDTKPGIGATWVCPHVDHACGGSWAQCQVAMASDAERVQRGEPRKWPLDPSVAFTLGPDFIPRRP